MQGFFIALYNVITVVSDALELPSRLLGIIAIPSAVIAYLSGRRRRRAEGPTGFNETLATDLRQGLASIHAALATLQGQQAPEAPPISPTSSPAPQTSMPPLSSPPPPAPQTAPPMPPAYPASPGVPPYPVPAAPRPAYPSVPMSPSWLPFPAGSSAPVNTGPRSGLFGWAEHPALAICSALALILTLTSVIGIFATAPGVVQYSDGTFYNPPAFLTFIGIWGIGGLFALATSVWGAILAVKLKRGGWALAIVLGTGPMMFITLFAAPSLLTLIFAVRVPARLPPTPITAVQGL